jgi:hypothetical protein
MSLRVSCVAGEASMAGESEEGRRIGGKIS